jgi:hypothetical protein
MLGIGRRQFITLLGGATGWPFVAGAQHTAMPDDQVSQRRIVLGLCTDGGRLPKGLGEPAYSSLCLP